MELQELENKGWEMMRQELDRELPLAVTLPVLAQSSARERWARRSVILLLLLWVLGGLGLTFSYVRSFEKKQQRKAPLVQKAVVATPSMAKNWAAPMNDNNEKNTVANTANTHIAKQISSNQASNDTPTSLPNAKKSLSKTTIESATPSKKQQHIVNRKHSEPILETTQNTTFNAPINQNEAIGNIVDALPMRSVSEIAVPSEIIAVETELPLVGNVRCPGFNPNPNTKRLWHLGNEIALRYNGFSAGVLFAKPLNRKMGLQFNAAFVQHWTGATQVYAQEALDVAFSNTPRTISAQLENVNWLQLGAAMRFQPAGRSRWSFSTGVNVQRMLSTTLFDNTVNVNTTNIPTTAGTNNKGVADAAFVQAMETQNLQNWHFSLQTAAYYRLAKHWELGIQGNLGLHNLYLATNGQKDYQHSAGIALRYWWK
jgi:hypothetical protein